MNGIDTYFSAISRLQQEVISAQHDLLHHAAEAMADTIYQNKRIFIFGTGHSHMLAEGNYSGK